MKKCQLLIAAAAAVLAMSAFANTATVTSRSLSIQPKASLIASDQSSDQAAANNNQANADQNNDQNDTTNTGDDQSDANTE